MIFKGLSLNDALFLIFSGPAPVFLSPDRNYNVDYKTTYCHCQCYKRMTKPAQELMFFSDTGQSFRQGRCPVVFY